MTFLGSNQSSTLDGNGNVVNSVLAATGVNGLSVATVATNFIYSTNNSSTTQLASNTSYTGTIDSTLSQPAVSLLMTADQNMLLTLRQFIDAAGTYAVTPMTFYVPAGQQFSRSVVVNGNYVQMVATNQGSATTTTFRLDTAYGSIDAVDSQGNKPTVSYITGQTTGDFDSVPLLDNAIRGDLALHTKSINNPTQDVNGNLILSDAPTTGRFTGIVPQAIIIDTLGYQSIQVTTAAFTGSLTGSNDNITYTTIFGYNLASYASISSFTANGSFAIPINTRYIKITTATAGSLTYYLRNTAFVVPAVNFIAGTAVSASTAQLGMSLVNIGAAAQSSTNPLFVSPLALAATNNQTIGQSIITATAAAVVQAKASAGRITMLNMQNNSANIAFLHLQNNAAATTSTASVQTYVIPASIGSFVNVSLPDGGLYLSAGIAFTVSSVITSGDATALTSPSLVVNYSFI